MLFNFNYIYHCIVQLLFGSDDLIVIREPGVVLSFPAPREHVLVLIIIRSVLILGLLTFGATTPHASLRRLLILSVALCLGYLY